MSLREEVTALLGDDDGPRVRLRFGKIVAVRAANHYPNTPWPTVDVSLGGGPTLPGIRYDVGLAPAAGQTVYCFRQGTTLIVGGRLA